jgi:hypothetical protein
MAGSQKVTVDRSYFEAIIRRADFVCLLRSNVSCIRATDLAAYVFSRRRSAAFYYQRLDLASGI